MLEKTSLKFLENFLNDPTNPRTQFLAKMVIRSGRFAGEFSTKFKKETPILGDVQELYLSSRKLLGKTPQAADFEKLQELSIALAKKLEKSGDAPKGFAHMLDLVDGHGKIARKKAISLMKLIRGLSIPKGTQEAMLGGIMALSIDPIRTEPTSTEDWKCMLMVLIFSLFIVFNIKIVNDLKTRAQFEGEERKKFEAKMKRENYIFLIAGIICFVILKFL